MKKLCKGLLVFLLVLCLTTAGLNLLVIFGTRDRIRSAEQVQPADCILVLGSGLLADGTPGRMLTRRLNTAIDLYQCGAAPKLLMSGDHGSDDYDEVNAMKRYAVEHNVPPEDIFMDHAGFCTYDSMYRAKAIFGCESVIVVTQPYHLYRAIWNAQGQGMTAQGVSAEMYDYGWRYTAGLYAREALARVKDVFVTLLHLPTAAGGDPVDIHGSGSVTDDGATAQWLGAM
ncbi:MAG: YdcF family protein [Clostridia bacterium]|nr:YdcF family protein [Clostridia bacterium]